MSGHTGSGYIKTFKYFEYFDEKINNKFLGWLRFIEYE